MLPARLRRQVAAVAETTEAPSTSHPAVPPARLSLVGTASQQHERLAFGHRSRDGSTSQRRVEPYRQVLVRRRWYLLAWDLDRGQWRTFRLDRLADVRSTGERFAPRALPAETAAAYIDAALKVPRHRAVITFLAPAAQVTGRLSDGDGTLEPLAGDRCRFTTWVDSFEWLAVMTVMTGVEFRVEEPVGFVTYCAELRDRLGRAVAG
ncbi:helix-turn-helix transcriptional regulator [Pseudonocardia sp. GCM10023141]|uniref:helix-turn-helix transcriptional regulator n=1 Tax=Pseudonocardia sp. GCM10023141 TaxID=3252653 RepID=UPI003617D76E